MGKVTQFLSSYKTPLLYSGGSLTKAFAQMIVGFVIARYVSPVDLGIWTTINLAVTYSVFLQAGLINGLNLELPYAYGRGEVNQAERMAGTVQFFTVVSSFLVLIIGIAYFKFGAEHDLKIQYGVLAITIFIMLSYYQNYLMSTFRSKNSFIKLSVVQIVDAFVNLVTLVLVVYYSYYGLIIKAVLVLLIYVILLHILRPIKVGLSWDKKSLIKLLKIGLPIFGLAYVESVSSTVDKLLLLKYSDLANVGLYTFGFYSLTTFTLFSSSVASYIYPRMSYNYGKNNDKLLLWKYSKKITIILISIQLPLAIFGYYAVPVIVENFFPKYVQSILVMQILLFAGVFRGSVVGVNALWSLKSWKYMIIYQVFFSVLLIILPFIGINLFPDKIEGVAYGVCLAHFINLMSGITLTYIATHKNDDNLVADGV